MRSCEVFLKSVIVAALMSASVLGQSGLISIADDKADAATFRFNDCISFEARSDKKDVHFAIVMQKPLQEGMFTCLHVYLDCDNNPATGMNRAELWVRASVGSRFHPNDYAAKGEQAAISIRRASLSRIERELGINGGKSKSWLHTDLLDEPQVEGKTLRFHVPTSFIQEVGSRYGTIIGIRARVETSSSDQPLMMRHLCTDKGIPIVVDGKDKDWSAKDVRQDASNELHQVAQELDITSLRVEHDATNLFACVTLAQGGLGRSQTSSTEIERREGVAIYVEPTYPRYQKPFKAFITYGESTQTGSSRDGQQNWNASLEAKVLEFQVDLKAGQGSFRIWAWSDLKRYDQVGDYQYVKLDWGKKG